MESTPQTTLSTDPARGEAMTVRRFFTRPGVHPFDTVEWEVRDRRRSAPFGQDDVEFPTHLVAELDEHRRPEVLPRPARLADARALGQADDRPRAGHDRRLGPRSAATSPPPRTATPSRPS